MTIRKGFTLIELLIVITIIGILAVAVLSAINPIEQIRRATDQGIDSDAAELLNGLERYYTAFFEYPWDALGEADPNQILAQDSWVTELIDKGEVKPQFADRDSWDVIFVTLAGTVPRLCFDPASSSVQEQADSEGKNKDGSSGCTSNCYRCIPR
ncbi:MAG: prepilin-type N-terminal cleavage/methylation domain-containing protein [Patescibacteria group bacterium]